MKQETRTKVFRDARLRVISTKSDYRSSIKYRGLGHSEDLRTEVNTKIINNVLKNMCVCVYMHMFKGHGYEFPEKEK